MADQPVSESPPSSVPPNEFFLLIIPDNTPPYFIRYDSFETLRGSIPRVMSEIQDSSSIRFAFISGSVLELTELLPSVTYKLQGPTGEIYEHTCRTGPPISDQHTVPVISPSDPPPKAQKSPFKG